jgi:peptidoglycan glycosyltransferase
VNAPIARLYMLFAVLFLVLIGFTSRWTVFEADGLNANELNRRGVFEEQQIRRGRIRAADGTVLARSEAAQDDTFTRRYPNGELFSHVIGYSYTQLGRAGLEQSRNEELSGKRGELGSVVDRIVGRTPVGDNLQTTLDPDAQRIALSALGGRRGAVVAIEPATGAIKVMASVPGFDPADLRSTDTFRSLANAEGSPLLNRATQGTYPPGSTMKVVTAAAALDSGEYTPTTTVDGNSGIDISGVPLANSGGRDFGPVTLTTALTNSVNTVWAQVAEDLGKDTMAEYMERFGFHEDPPLDYPPEQMNPSGSFVDGGRRLVTARSRFVDVGRMSIGQDRLQVTPLQMAMVAAAIANEGSLMKPRFVERVVDSDGRTTERIDPEEHARVMSPESARELIEMMAQVVREGTGTAAALQGIDVAGKTGTAEIIPDQDVNQPWFIGFAPARNPKIAVAVTVERSIGGQGGTVAAPIAKQVMESLTDG